MKKEYQVSDLFYDDWRKVKPKIHVEVFALQQKLNSISKEDPEYGFILIRILRLLRRKALLVDKINVEQAVDCYNELKFLNQPWHFFPEIKNLITPDDYLARHTFDHFIYADGEFTSYIVKNDESYLRKLVVSLYQETQGEYFYRDEINFRAEKLSVKPWQLMLVFFTFAHVRNFITNRCKNLLPKSKATEETTPQVSFAMWDDIKHAAVRTGVFGDFTAQGRANVYDVLDHLEKLAKDRKEANAHN